MEEEEEEEGLNGGGGGGVLKRRCSHLQPLFFCCCLFLFFLFFPHFLAARVINTSSSSYFSFTTLLSIFPSSSANVSPLCFRPRPELHAAPLACGRSAPPESEHLPSSYLQLLRAEHKSPSQTSLSAASTNGGSVFVDKRSERLSLMRRRRSPGDSQQPRVVSPRFRQVFPSSHGSVSCCRQATGTGVLRR